MAEILWRTLLSQSSAASLADDDIRELTAEFATGIGESFYWPGSAVSQGASTASSGELQPGSARVPGVNVVNTALFDSVDGEVTAIFWKGTTVATPTLIHGGSTSSFVIGGSLAIEASPVPEAAAPFGSRWIAVDSTSTFILSGTPAENSFATNVDFGTTFGAVPNVQVSFSGLGLLGSGDNIIYGVDNVTTSGCSSYMSFIGTPSGSGSAFILTMFLRSEGTVAL